MLEVRHKNLGAVAVLRLRGQFVNGETEILRETLNSIAGVRTVVLDFERVTTIDAHGLGVMLDFREQAERRNTRIELANVSRLVANVLKMARLDSVFQISSRLEYTPTASRHKPMAGRVLASCA